MEEEREEDSIVFLSPPPPPQGPPSFNVLLSWIHCTFLHTSFSFLFISFSLFPSGESGRPWRVDMRRVRLYAWPRNVLPRSLSFSLFSQSQYFVISCVLGLWSGRACEQTGAETSSILSHLTSDNFHVSLSLPLLLNSSLFHLPVTFSLYLPLGMRPSHSQSLPTWGRRRHRWPHNRSGIEAMEGGRQWTSGGSLAVVGHQPAWGRGQAPHCDWSASITLSCLFLLHFFSIDAKFPLLPLFSSFLFLFTLAKVMSLFLFLVISPFSPSPPFLSFSPLSLLLLFEFTNSLVPHPLQFTDELQMREFYVENDLLSAEVFHFNLMKNISLLILVWCAGSTILSRWISCHSNEIYQIWKAPSRTACHSLTQFD